MYETSASRGSGLVLDPIKGGPQPISLNYYESSFVQLALYVTISNVSTFSVGPANAFTQIFHPLSPYDHDVFVSSSSIPELNMDAWYSSGPIDQEIPSDGNIRAFDFPDTQIGGYGQGFYVRTGTTGSYRYARVFVKNVGGKLLQGTVPERFIELEISYQQAPNVPYAKPAMRSAPPGIISTRRR
jgi:hypothetical protein